MNQEPKEVRDEHPLLRSDFMSVGAGPTYTRLIDDTEKTST